MANPLQNNQGSFWSRLPPGRKQTFVIVGAIVGAMLLIFPFLTAGPPGRKAVQSALDNILTDADTHNLGLGGLSKQVDELTRQLAEIQKAQKDAAGGKGIGPGQSSDLNEAALKRLAKLEGEIQIHNAGTSSPSQAGGLVQPTGISPAPPQKGNVPSGVASNAGQRPDADGVAGLTLHRMRVIRQEAPAAAGTNTSASGATITKGSTGAAAAKAQAAVGKAYIPSGSIMSGVLITGLDAATGRGSTQDPIPVLIRLKHESILPNRFRADYRECFMIAAGYGDLSSERAYLRAESISCVRNDGKVIDSRIEAYAVGEDGKAGMRGHLVSKQGQAIAKAAIAGFAQSYAQALQPNNSAGVGGAAGGFTGAGLQEGAYGGAGAALDRVAKFYVDSANQMFPVVEIDAGRQVSMVAVKGVSLALVQ
jgi:conjugal transfer pilus assembly protein TraB